jgi:hypothetical protein
MATLEEWQASQKGGSISNAGEDFNFGSEDSAWYTSMLAAIPSGLFKIAEGITTLGATLLDLGVDKDRAEAVEDFFAKINPFDEAANATAAGKITELIVNLGVPGVPAFNMASGLAKATATAKQSGKYLSTMEKARRIGKGSLATGVSDALFVGDVEGAGTFGDFMGGPTQLDRDSSSPYAEILNRIKFGTEGVGFAGLIGGIGMGASQLRNQTGTGRAITGKMNKFLETISKGIRSRSGQDVDQFLINNARRGDIDADLLEAVTMKDTIEGVTKDVARKYGKIAGNKIAEPKLQNKMMIELNDLLTSGSGKGGRMMPMFDEVAEVAIDPKTGYAFKNGAGSLEDVSAQLPLQKQVKIPDPVTGKEIMQDVFTGKTNMKVGIEPMDPDKVKALGKKFIKEYKATAPQVRNLFNTLTSGREKFAEQLTAIGRRLDPDSFVKFREAVEESLTNVVDRGYQVFKNNKNQFTTAVNYPPTKQLLKKTMNYYKKVARQKGYNVGNGPGQIGDDVFERLVRETWESSTQDRGFILSSAVRPGTVKFGSLPKFFKASVADDLATADKSFVETVTTNLDEVTGMDRKIIERLLGKTKNPMDTLVDGISNLSAQVRNSEAFDNMVIKSNARKLAYDKWLNGFKQTDGTVVAPKTGPEPQLPFLYDDLGEAQKYSGGGATDYTTIVPLQGDAARKIDRFVDTKLSLKGVDDVEQAKINEAKRLAESQGLAVQKIINPIAGKVALNDVAEAFLKTEESMKGLGAQIYNNLVLYPKGTSQMAKTILAPFTHVRNFISATAFAGANGILPFGNIKDVKAAWTALQAAGPGMKQSNEFYQELLRLGVVNSNVRLKQVQDLLQDANFGAILNNKNSDWALNKLMKRFSKIKKGAEDFYTAEDDFWKIFTFLGEKAKIKNAYRDAGLRLGQEFTDMNGVKRLFNDRTLNELSADLVRNNVPNYSYVSDFVKGLRKFPLGNFVAFPAEIMRTGMNIIDTAIKEINYTIKIGDKVLKPFAARGRQRLMGMAITTAAIPLGTIEAMKTLYDISDEERNAMRRYVADWSKNSVLIPFKNEEGKMQYIDFSHLNAYDTLTRPIQTVLNKIEDGRADEDGIIDDAVLGLIESTKELLSPFVSESIWTEALQDVAPILGRDGTDSEGRRIWNPQDSIGDKLYKAVAHLVEAQAPLNWKQLQRLGISMLPVDAKGSFDERGNQYEFGNEALGIAGLRRVDVDPQKSFNYKITEYKTGVRDSRNLFTAATLKGGIVSPKEIVDAYINANRALYGVNRNLYEDIKAAQILGTSEDFLYDRMDNRGEKKAFNAINEGEFRPLTLSDDLKELFSIRAEELNVTDPYDAAADIIDQIKDQLENITLGGDLFPDIQNPLDTNLVEGITDIVAGATLPNINTGFLGQGNVTIPNNTGLVYNENAPLANRIDTIAKVDSLI